jgi:hypothetical protein
VSTPSDLAGRYVLTIDLPLADASRAPEVVRRDLAARALAAGLRGERRLARYYSAAARPSGCSHDPEDRTRRTYDGSLVEACLACGSIRSREETP